MNVNKKTFLVKNRAQPSDAPAVSDVRGKITLHSTQIHFLPNNMICGKITQTHTHTQKSRQYTGATRSVYSAVSLFYILFYRECTSCLYYENKVFYRGKHLRNITLKLRVCSKDVCCFKVLQVFLGYNFKINT